MCSTHSRTRMAMNGNSVHNFPVSFALFLSVFFQCPVVTVVCLDVFAARDLEHLADKGRDGHVHGVFFQILHVCYLIESIYFLNR